MIQRFLDLWPLIEEIHKDQTSTFAQNFDRSDLPSPADIKTLSSCISVLGPLRVFNARLQNREFLFADVAPCMVNLFVAMHGDNALEKKVEQLMHSKFDCLFPPRSLALAASALCPEHQNFQFLAPLKLPGEIEDLKKSAWDRLLDEALYFPLDGIDESLCPTVWSNELSAARQMLAKASLQVKPLVYWAAATGFPRLRPLIRAMFSIQATSCESERLWSSAGNLHQDRQGLTPEHLSQLTLIKFWVQLVRGTSSDQKDLLADVLKSLKRNSAEASTN